jgi:hypothetical protein
MNWPLFVVALRGRRQTGMNDSSETSVEPGGLIPEQRLEPPNPRLITAGIATIKDMETLRACVAYENANQQRVQILRRLERRASEIRAQVD